MKNKGVMNMTQAVNRDGKRFKDASQGVAFFTSNKLKVIAVLTMVADHFVDGIFPPDLSMGPPAWWWMAVKCLGRLSIALMCFFIAEGFHYTSNKWKYLSRMAIFAIISHAPYNLLFSRVDAPILSVLNPLNGTSVIWALTMGLLALMIVKSEAIKNNVLGILLKVIGVGVCCALAYTANWNYIAVLWIVGFGIFRGNVKLQTLSFIIIGTGIYVAPMLLDFYQGDISYLKWFFFGIYAAIPFYFLYSGKRGKKSKAVTWSFYIVYPGHLLLFYAIKALDFYGIINI